MTLLELSVERCLLNQLPKRGMFFRNDHERERERDAILKREGTDSTACRSLVGGWVVGEQ